MIGTQVSHYKIVEKLGEGGMGIVYKALDTRLDRTVALKFLPAHLNASRQDKARFIQEAKAAATLNHPNICTIHDIQEHDGQMFMVMEFVDGLTLREKKGTLSFKQVIDCGIQVADGLSAAHEKGIVHRDIKPENIMIRRDGIAQIMDFGLAKLRDTTSAVNRLTKQGSTVGTAGYMSPEQVQGMDVDHRSDIFSYGVLLYEQFTGQLPFKGVHETALAYEIVNVDAAPMGTIKPDIDPNLDAIVLDCLEKDPKERCQSVAEVARDLRRIKRESTRQRHSRITAVRPAYSGAAHSGVDASRPSAVTGPSGEAPSGEAPSSRGIPLRVRTAALAVLLLGAGYGVSFLTRPSAAVVPIIRAGISIPAGVRYLSDVGGNSAISPDGSMITFVATDSQSQTNLWVRRLSSNDAKLLTGTDKAQYPFWSPDSRAIGFFADGKLKTIDRDGGPVLSIADAPFGRGGAWTPAGQIIFAPNLSDARLFSVPATGGPVKTALAFDTSLHRMPRYPELLPDGNKLLVALLEIPSNSADVYVAGLDGSAPVKLLTDCSYPRYASGYLFYVRQGILMAQQLDPSSLKLTGAPVAIQDHVDMWAARAKADYSLSENGMLLYSAAATAKSNELIFMHIDGSEEVVGQFDQFRSISSSPDDSQVAYEVIDMTKSLTSIWIYNFATKVQSQLTFGGNGAGNPVWSRDGRAIYLNEEVGPSKASIFVLSADGSGNKELVARGEEGSPIGYYPQDISPDGRYLIVCLKSESAGELGMVDLGAQARPLPVRKLGVKGINARFSPDGRWIVYESDEGGSAKIYVSSFPAKPGMWQVSADGSEPLWGTNQLSYYSRSRDRYEAVDVTLTSGTPVFGPPHPLFSGGKSQSVFIFGVTHDGKRYLAFRPVNSGANVGLSLVVNWKGLLESEKH